MEWRRRPRRETGEAVRRAPRRAAGELPAATVRDRVRPTVARPRSREGRDEGEFPEGADAPPRVTRRELLQLLGANAALAGAAGCSRGPPELIVPYVRPAAGGHAGVPSSLRDHDVARRVRRRRSSSRATRAGRRRSRATRCTRRASARSGRFEQASVLVALRPGARARAITRDGAAVDVARAARRDRGAAGSPRQERARAARADERPHVGTSSVERVRAHGRGRALRRAAVARRGVGGRAARLRARARAAMGLRAGRGGARARRGLPGGGGVAAGVGARVGVAGGRLRPRRATR